MVAGTRPEPSGWDIDDPVTHLRVWGTDQLYPLHGLPNGTLGTAEECGIRVVDPSLRASRRHAEIVFGEMRVVRDLASTNGTQCDGESRATFELTPGVEIGIGGVTLIAESARFCALRAYVSRLLGWSSERRVAVDRALRATREMATRRAALIIAGAGHLVPIARRIHEHVLPLSVPFSTETDAGDAGTLCVVEQRRPRNLVLALTSALRPDGQTRVIVCCETLTDASDIVTMLGRASPIEIPALASRTSDTDRLLAEYAHDAVAALGVSHDGFRPNEMRWLGALPYASLDEVEDTARRVVAIRNLGVSRGAARLGITHAAISRWAKRRKIPT